MRECKKCDNLVTDEQVKNCEVDDCDLRFAMNLTYNDGTMVFSKEFAEMDGFSFGAVKSAVLQKDYWVVGFSFSRGKDAHKPKSVTWSDVGRKKELLNSGHVFESEADCQKFCDYLNTYKRPSAFVVDSDQIGEALQAIENTRKAVGSPEPSDQFTTLTNIAPGTGDGFSVAPRQEPIPSSMAMKFEVFGDPGQLANLSQRVLEILNEDDGVKIREFNYHISG